MIRIDFKLEWSIDSREGIDRFEISRSNYENTNYVVIGSVPGDVLNLEYIDQNVDVRKPTSPSNLVVDIHDTLGAKLSFNPSIDNNIRRYYCIRSVDAYENKSKPLKGNKKPSEGISRYEWQLYDTGRSRIVDSGTLSGLSTETPRTQVDCGTYRYSIYSYDLAGNQSNTNTISFNSYIYEKWSASNVSYSPSDWWTTPILQSGTSSMQLWTYQNIGFNYNGGYYTVVGSPSTVHLGGSGYRVDPNSNNRLQYWNGSSNQWYMNYQEVMVIVRPNYTKRELIGHVTGSDYPLNGIHTDGYWYIRCDQTDFESYTVTFNVHPLADSIIVDGNHIMGNTIELSDGNYSYTIIKSGYETKVGSFTVSGSDLTISISLEVFVPATLDGWESKTIGSNQEYSSVYYKNNKWVAVSLQGTIVTSNNGDDWTITATFDKGILCVYASNNRWVAVGYDAYIYTSSDATNWTRKKVGNTNVYTSVIFKDNRWIVAGAQGAVAHSVDGINWTIVHTISNVFLISTASLKGIHRKDNMWIIHDNNYRTWHSTNLNDWTRIGLDDTNYWGAGLPFGQPNIGFAYGNLYVIAHRIGISTTTDLYNYSFFSFGQNEEPTSVYCHDGKWIVITQFASASSDPPRGRIYSSTNGYTWNLVWTSDSYNVPNDVYYSNGNWLAVGRRDTVVKSTDGINWLFKPTTGSFNNLNAVYANGNKWVAVGRSSRIVTNTLP